MTVMAASEAFERFARALGHRTERAVYAVAASARRPRSGPCMRSPRTPRSATTRPTRRSDGSRRPGSSHVSISPADPTATDGPSRWATSRTAQPPRAGRLLTRCAACRSLPTARTSGTTLTSTFASAPWPASSAGMPPPARPHAPEWAGNQRSPVGGLLSGLGEDARLVPRRAASRRQETTNWWDAPPLSGGGAAHPSGRDPLASPRTAGPSTSSPGAAFRTRSQTPRPHLPDRGGHSPKPFRRRRLRRAAQIDGQVARAM